MNEGCLIFDVYELLLDYSSTKKKTVIGILPITV